MNKLVDMLKKKGIPHLRLPTLDTEAGKFSMLLYPSKDDTHVIVSQFPEKTTMFDTMLVGDEGDSFGWGVITEILDRQEIFCRIEKHWNSMKGD